MVSLNDIVGRIVAVVSSIALAWAGWGYWALVAGAVAQYLSRMHWKLGELPVASRFAT